MSILYVVKEITTRVSSTELGLDREKGKEGGGRNEMLVIRRVQN